MDKFQRNYRMTVQLTKAGDVAIISYPITLEFSVRRLNLSTAGTATFRLYNLNKTNRDQIFKGPNDYGVVRHIKLEAGYGSSLENLTTIFNGNIIEAKSGRTEGQVNYITEIECQDFGFAMQNSHSNWTEGPGVTKDSVVRKLAGDMKDKTTAGLVSMPVGAISTFEGKYDRGFTVNNNTWDTLKTVTENQCNIDLGKIFIVKREDAFFRPLRIINSLSGLLGTPKRNNNWIQFDMLFEPDLQVNQIIILDSSSQTKFNGQYKVIGLEHTGVISGAVGGKCKTKVTLQIGNTGTGNQFGIIQVK